MTDRFHFRRLAVADAPRLQPFFDRCSEFFLRSEGLEADAAEEIAACAPGKSEADTFAMAVVESDRTIGFAHLTRDHPKLGEWWLGLLLLDPDVRGRGIGSEVHDGLRRSFGSPKTWIGVRAWNARALKYWTRVGYVERERQQYRMRSGQTCEVILLST